MQIGKTTDLYYIKNRIVEVVKKTDAELNEDPLKLIAIN